MAERENDVTIEYLPEDGGSAAPAPGAPGRGRRGRKRLLVIGLLVLLVAAGAAGALVLGRAPASPAATIAAPVPGTGLSRELDQAGFGGPVGGSLAGDPAALAQIRDRVAVLAAAGDQVPTTPGQVIVLWAGDLGAGRYASVLYRQEDGWSRAVLTGPAGTAPARLTKAGWDDDDPDFSSELSDASAAFVGSPGPEGSGVVLVVAPKAHGVEIATARQFRPGGSVTTRWRPLRKQGGVVWAGVLDDNELYLGEYRTDIDTEGGRLPVVAFGPATGRNAAQQIATGSQAHSEDGRRALDCAADQARQLGTSLGERTVLARAGALDKETLIGVVVLRSSGGGWVWGLCDEETTRSDGSWSRGENPGSGVAQEHWDDAGQVMVSVPASLDDGNGDDGLPRLVVLAPAGADHVRVAGVTAKVRERLAEITLPKDFEVAGASVEALEHGRVVATITNEDH